MEKKCDSDSGNEGKINDGIVDIAMDRKFPLPVKRQTVSRFSRARSFSGTRVYSSRNNNKRIRHQSANRGRFRPRHFYPPHRPAQIRRSSASNKKIVDGKKRKIERNLSHYEELIEKMNRETSMQCFNAFANESAQQAPASNLDKDPSLMNEDEKLRSIINLIRSDGKSRLDDPNYVPKNQKQKTQVGAGENTPLAAFSQHNPYKPKQASNTVKNDSPEEETLEKYLVEKPYARRRAAVPQSQKRSFSKECHQIINESNPRVKEIHQARKYMKQQCTVDNVNDPEESLPRRRNIRKIQQVSDEQRKKLAEEALRISTLTNPHKPIAENRSIRTTEEQQEFAKLLASDTVEDLDLDNENLSGVHGNDASVERCDYVNRYKIFNAPEIKDSLYVCKAIDPYLKKHQVNGIRFLYDNLIVSEEAFWKTEGNGAILAHVMGLGKSLQIIAFLDCIYRFMRRKPRVLLVVPVNCLDHWRAEFNKWLPIRHRPRSMKLFYFDKQIADRRVEVVRSWKQKKGILLLGYEIFHRMSNTSPTFTSSTSNKAKTSSAPLPSCSKEAMSDPDELLLHEFDDTDVDEFDKEMEEIEGSSDEDGDDCSDEVSDILLNAADMVICDEGHRIKNCKAGISKALKAVRTKRRLILTGTPLQNNLTEYWCMMDFVRPGLLGTKKAFDNMFRNPIENGQCIDSDPCDVSLMIKRTYLLQKVLMGTVQRRGFEVVRTDLPPKTEVVIPLNQYTLQSRLAWTTLTVVSQRLSNYDSNYVNPILMYAMFKKIFAHPMIFLDMVRRLRSTPPEGEEFIDPVDFQDHQDIFCVQRSRRNHSNLVDIARSDKWDRYLTKFFGPEHDKPMLLTQSMSPKLQFMRKLIEEIMLLGEKVLVFTQSVNTLDMIQRFMTEVWGKFRMKKGNEYVGAEWEINETFIRFDGSTQVKDRTRKIASFNNPRSNLKVFLISTEAGGIGINLSAASRVILFDVCWNPCHDEQAIARVYRMGQSRPCFIYRLVMTSCMEERVFSRQVQKQSVAYRVVDRRHLQRSMTRNEILELYCFDKLQEFNRRLEEKDKAFRDKIMLHDHETQFEEEESMFHCEVGLKVKQVSVAPTSFYEVKDTLESLTKTVSKPAGRPVLPTKEEDEEDFQPVNEPITTKQITSYDSVLNKTIDCRGKLCSRSPFEIDSLLRRDTGDSLSREGKKQALHEWKNFMKYDLHGDYEFDGLTSDLTSQEKKGKLTKRVLPSAQGEYLNEEESEMFRKMQNMCRPQIQRADNRLCLPDSDGSRVVYNIHHLIAQLNRKGYPAWHENDDAGMEHMFVVHGDIIYQVVQGSGRLIPRGNLRDFKDLPAHVENYHKTGTIRTFVGPNANGKY